MLPHHSINMPAIQATVDNTKNDITKKRQYTKNKQEPPATCIGTHLYYKRGIWKPADWWYPPFMDLRMSA
jgi:hypothetical protein